MIMYKNKVLKNFLHTLNTNNTKYYIFCNNCKNYLSYKKPVLCDKCNTLLWCGECSEYKNVVDDKWCCNTCSENNRIEYIKISTRHNNKLEHYDLWNYILPA